MTLNIKISVIKDTLIMRPIGEIDQSTSEKVKDKIEEIIKKYGVNNIVFNCRELHFMDSSGIGVILSAYNRLRAIRGKIVMCELNRDIEKIIFLAGLNKICRIIDSEDTAKWQLGVA